MPHEPSDDAQEEAFPRAAPPSESKLRVPIELQRPSLGTAPRARVPRVAGPERVRGPSLLVTLVVALSFLALGVVAVLFDRGVVRRPRGEPSVTPSTTPARPATAQPAPRPIPVAPNPQALVPSDPIARGCSCVRDESKTPEARGACADDLIALNDEEALACLRAFADENTEGFAADEIRARLARKGGKFVPPESDPTPMGKAEQEKPNP